MTLAWSVPLPHADKIVLLALSDNANDEGLCYPSVATLSRKCSLEQRSIFRVIKRLEDGGHVTRRERPGRSTVYMVHPVTPDQKSPLTESQPCQRVTPDGKSVLTQSQRPPDRGSSPPLTQGQATPDRGSPITIIEPSNEPSGNRETRAARSTAQRLPDDFELTEARRLVAKNEQVDAEREFGRFRDHWRAASGANARKHDWDAAWRNWCRKAADLNAPAQPPRGRAGEARAVVDSNRLRELTASRDGTPLADFRDPYGFESAENYLSALRTEANVRGVRQSLAKTPLGRLLG